MTGKDLHTEVDFLKSEVKRLRKSLSELTPALSVILKRRGFKIYKKEPPDDLLIPRESFIDSYYEMLKRYSFRLFLRDVIKHQPLFTLQQVTRYATKEVTGEYIDYLIKTGLIVSEDGAYNLAGRPIKSFGDTLEWFMAEILKREFSVETVWGVKIKGRSIGGDYDLLSKIDGSVLYMEIKSSPPKQIYLNEISAFFDRVYDLMPEIAIFFMDTELRMKDKIVPMFEDELKMRFSGPPEVTRMEKELFEMQTERPKIFIINSKDSIVNNIEKVLIRYFRGYN
ncbi:MAG: hypothetical protein M1147_09415 [Nitrospirae bacterium]|nr:hypothetical protein [Nitrospirota bacterium]MCL5978314.1 hypothetical protein [Nitrospirota bacterium]